MQAVRTADPEVDTIAERERCAALAEARARAFETMKMYPIARAMIALARQIRSASPSG
jgi:hypothetical protein